MSRHDTAGDAFDARLRDVHARSLDHLSPRVHAQLALRRREALQGAAPRSPRRLLPWAGMATAAIALALVVQLRPPSSSGPAAQSATAGPARQAPRLAAVGPADIASISPDLLEDPDFYLWLGNAGPARPE